MKICFKIKDGLYVLSLCDRVKDIRSSWYDLLILSNVCALSKYVIVIRFRKCYVFILKKVIVVCS
jgi:hypothetical protein